VIARGSTIMIEAHSQYRGLFMGVARRLKAEFDAVIHLYCSNAQEVTYYQRLNQDNLFANIVDANILYPALRETAPPFEQVVDQSRAYEAKLGMTINELAVSDRHLGRGFALGGFGHPRSRMSEETDYRAMLHGFNSVIAFWEREIDGKAPALLINPSKIAAVLARRRGVSIRVVATSRYKNYFYWAADEFFQNPAVHERYGAITKAELAEIALPYEDHLKWRAHFRSLMTFPAMLKDVMYLIARRAYWHLRGYEKAKGYYLSEEIRHAWRLWRDARDQVRSGVPLASLVGKPFVYFPLHMEPEASLQLLSPECFAQLAVIAALARDLPAGVFLAVKETAAAIGRRPADFYAQIREFKNVIMLDPFEFGLEVVKKADVVATITGTGGFEGAVLGKPVITFGRRNLYNFLPHVYQVDDMATLKPALNKALAANFDRGLAHQNGSRFLAAVVAGSFDLTGFSSRQADVASEGAINAAFTALVEGLNAKTAQPDNPRSVAAI